MPSFFFLIYAKPLPSPAEFSMKNYINQTLILPVLLLLMLTGISLIPENLAVGNFKLRKMDIFADVRSGADSVAAPMDTISFDSTAWVETDTSMQVVVQPDSVGPLPPKDSSWFGKVIEDYSPAQTGLNRFFEAVDSIRQGRTVRVAWYGDSFVEGDILLGDLRDTLQTLWGGAGVGFVPVTSEVAQFKRTLKHIFRGWTTYSIVKKMESHPQFGISGYVYQPAADAKIHYEGASYFHHTTNWNHFRFFYSAQEETPFVWQQQDEAPQNGNLKQTDGRIKAWEWTANYPGTTAFAVRFPQPEGVLLYGASLESGPGIYIDNFSVRGNSGGPLKMIKQDVAQQFDRYQKYDLIVLQVGLNAVTNSLNNIKWYQAELDRTFAHLSACFPGKPILIVSVGDRANKIGTELKTMRSVPAIVAMQRDLARKHGFLFYDLYFGMGGPGSIIDMANHKPRYANLDYTHLTHDGGRYLGYHFATLFTEEQVKWRAAKTQ
jgi:hypothetical protein